MKLYIGPNFTQYYPHTLYDLRTILLKFYIQVFMTTLFTNPMMVHIWCCIWYLYDIVTEFFEFFVMLFVDVFHFWHRIKNA